MPTSHETEERTEPGNHSGAPRRLAPVTVIVPAYNEAATIEATLRSLRSQTLPPQRVIVVDDCSDDDTGEVARRCGATVLRPLRNTGSKAGAQNVALPLVETQFTIAIDADTTLAPDAIEKVLAAFDRENVAAACGFVLPQRVRSLWERGRYLEYMFAFSFAKPVQDFYGKPLISSGCFSAYRTDVLRDLGGWSTRTMAEDMDLTWTLYQRGYEVRFVPEAVSYPLEPQDATFMRKQLTRWSHGFIQNVRLHWRQMLQLHYLRSMVAVAVWDSVVASLVMLAVLPILAVTVSPFFLIGYLLDAPAILIPALVTGVKRREVVRVLASYPSFLVLRAVNAFFMLRAMWREYVVGRTLLVYEKGH
ncbi:MAG TPA: glycosyltransferase [Actinomycetota bacterium]|jgi:poly-beta-1,6-N-acetyl-D-glucosamine synthase|nr:glycosyltransferase [Actinomycetota bacterium]